MRCLIVPESFLKSVGDPSFGEALKPFEERLTLPQLLPPCLHTSVHLCSHLCTDAQKISHRCRQSCRQIWGMRINMERNTVRWWKGCWSHTFCSYLCCFCCSPERLRAAADLSISIIFSEVSIYAQKLQLQFWELDGLILLQTRFLLNLRKTGFYSAFTKKPVFTDLLH